MKNMKKNCPNCENGSDYVFKNEEDITLVHTDTSKKIDNAYYHCTWCNKDFAYVSKVEVDANEQ